MPTKHMYVGPKKIFSSNKCKINIKSEVVWSNELSNSNCGRKTSSSQIKTYLFWIREEGMLPFDHSNYYFYDSVRR